MHIGHRRVVVVQHRSRRLGEPRGQVPVVHGHPPLRPFDVGQEVRHLRVRDQADDRRAAAERDHPGVAAHPDHQPGAGVRVPDLLGVEVVHRDHRHRDAVFAAQVERDPLVVQRVRRAPDLGPGAQRPDGGGHFGQEVAVVVAEAQPGPVVGRVDQDGVLALRRIGPARDESAADGRRAGLEPHLVVQVGRQQPPHLLDRTVVAQTEERRLADEQCAARR